MGRMYKENEHYETIIKGFLLWLSFRVLWSRIIFHQPLPLEWLVPHFLQGQPLPLLPAELWED